MSLEAAFSPYSRCQERSEATRSTSLSYRTEFPEFEFLFAMKQGHGAGSPPAYRPEPRLNLSLLAGHLGHRDARRFRHWLLDRGQFDDPLRVDHGLPGHLAFDHRYLGHTPAD